MEFNNRLLLKIIELVLTMTCIVIIESLGDQAYTSQAMLICGTLAGYLMICSTLLFGHFLGAPIDKRVDALFSIAASIMFVSSGAVIIDRWSRVNALAVQRNAIKAAGSLAIINGAVFVADIAGIAIACIVLFENVGTLSVRPMIVCGTIGGYTIICGVLLIGHLINSLVEKRLNGMFSLIGCLLFVISGALVIDEWHDSSDLLFKERKRNALAAGSLMIINGAVFLLDCLSIYRTREFIAVVKELPKNKVEISRF